MPYEIMLAIRYLRSRRWRKSARVTAVAAFLGIAFGVAALIVALALSNGFNDEMRDKILSGTAHITVMRRDGLRITDWQTVIKRARELAGVRDAFPTTYDGALLSSAGGSAYTLLRGIERESPQAVEELRRTIVTGSIDALLTEPSPFVTSTDSDAAIPNGVIGAELAERTNLRVGDLATIVSGESALTLPGTVPRIHTIRIAGIFKTGLYEYDSTWLFVSLDVASNFAGASSSSPSVLTVYVDDIYAVGEISERIEQQLGGAYTMLTWQEANRPFFAALALERRVGLLIISLIVLMATLNILTTLALVVVERRSDIAILTAMGARRRSIALIFMTEGTLIGLVGAAAGIGLGLLACFLGDHYKLVSLPADIYSIGNVPFHVRTLDVVLAGLVAFVLSLLATIYPARMAARIHPAEALRDS